ncbi:MAG: hypothetical protein ACMXYG_06420 [Candidatus Woesearchaeota archaeon]
MPLKENPEQLSNSYGSNSFDKDNQSNQNYSDDNSANDDDYDEEDADADDVKENNILYNPHRAKKFLIYIAKAVKRHDIRRNAHKDFHEHLEKIRTIKPKSKSLDQDIEDLKRKVSYLINLEKGAPHIDHDKYLPEKIQLLESKLNKLLESRRIREERFHELERKISTRMVADGRQIEQLKTKLLMMEKNLLQLQIKTKSKTKSKELKELKKKITDTKSVLEKY